MVLVLLLVSCLTAAAADEDFRVYSEHPRLFLTGQRLRLLKRERERQSPRWRQLDALVKGGAQMPEPGFAAALYYAVTGDAQAGKQAVDWALGTAATDLRQLATVYDWCQSAFRPGQAATLAAKIQRVMDQKPPATLSARRDRVLALIATADESHHGEEKPLREIVEQWWRAQFVPGLSTTPLYDLYALDEILHAVRDNLNIELGEDARDFFRDLPKYQILGTYPAPLSTAENEYRIPVYKESGEPNLDRAAMLRVAGLSLVAYDSNGLENQYLQGWLMLDRYMLQSSLGAPYEFLWANPYQPGLSYFQLPLLFHDAKSGALFIRSDWDDDAVWLGLYEGEAQLFRDGHITVLNRQPNAKPIAIGTATIVRGSIPAQFSFEGGPVLVVGLKPRHAYLIETDDEELRELETDPAGTLVLEYSPDRKATVRIHE